MPAFRMVRWSLVASVALGVFAMLVYPGGTALDPNVRGYSILSNFISDLGMTVAHNGTSNRLGAALFVGSFSLFVLSIVGGAIGFVRLHAALPVARLYAWLGAAGAVLVGVCLLGAALAPVNSAAWLHMTFARAATVIALPSLGLFALASARDRRLPASVSVAWLVLALAMAGWLAMGWGPGISSQATLTFYATAQKLVGVVAIGAVIYQTYQVETLR